MTEPCASRGGRVRPRNATSHRARFLAALGAHRAQLCETFSPVNDARSLRRHAVAPRAGARVVHRHHGVMRADEHPVPPAASASPRVAEGLADGQRRTPTVAPVRESRRIQRRAKAWLVRGALTQHGGERNYASARRTLAADGQLNVAATAATARIVHVQTLELDIRVGVQPILRGAGAPSRGSRPATLISPADVASEPTPVHAARGGARRFPARRNEHGVVGPRRRVHIQVVPDGMPRRLLHGRHIMSRLGVA